MFAATKEDIKNDVKTGASRINNDIRQTASNVRSDLKQASNQIDLEGTMNKIGQQAHDYLDTAANEINDVSSRLTNQIRKEPVQSTLVALVVGMLFGMALRR